MIEHSHVDERQRRLERRRQELVSARGFGNPGGMVVAEDKRGRVELERPLDHFCRINRGLQGLGRRRLRGRATGVRSRP